MQRGIRPACASLIVTISSLHIGAFSGAAQGPAQTGEGIITTFAPIVEKVAPSVVTVFTTQTVSPCRCGDCSPKNCRSVSSENGNALSPCDYIGASCKR